MTFPLYFSKIRENRLCFVKFRNFKSELIYFRIHIGYFNILFINLCNYLLTMSLNECIRKELYYLYIYIICLYILNIRTNGEVFTAVTKIGEMLKTVENILMNFNIYLQAEQERLEYIKKKSEKIVGPKLRDEIEDIKYLNNPINIYHLVKRLNVFMSAMNKTSFEDVFEYHEKIKVSNILPNEQDITGVILALHRLQATYDIPINAFVKGEIATGFKSVKELSASDCLHIAKTLVKNNFISESFGWIEESLRQEKKEIIKSINRRTVLLELSFEYFKMGNYSRAVRHAKELLKIDPKADVPYPLFKSRLKAEKKLRKGEVEKKEPDKRTRYLAKRDKLCRAERLLDPKHAANLKCYYSKVNLPYMTLQKIKVEDVHLDPSLTIYYDVLNDMEIELIKNLSSPLLERAEIEGVAGAGSVTDDRISKSAWLQDSAHPVIAKITERVEGITGLETKVASEPLQIVNYGVGGHYDIHVDFEEDKVGHIFAKRGRRIATLLFYMNDVHAGGATVFPSLDVAVWPKKGSAVFWYNLLKSGDPDYATAHTACPVLVGTKWVSNKWIHSYEQEFRRPCGLKETDIY